MTFGCPMLPKVAHTVEGLKSISEPVLKAILSRVCLIHAILVGGAAGFVVIVLATYWAYCLYCSSDLRRL
jgi:hypothetical protein